MKVTILGCGPSNGIPALDYGWGSCDPNNPRNRRTRASILIEARAANDGTDRTILIDTSPDLRAQLLAANVRTLDGLVYTHGHADHLHGVDDLRAINRNIGGPIPMWADDATLHKMEQAFGYALQGIPEGQPIFRPWLQPHRITESAFSVAGVPVQPFAQDHGWGVTQGLRFGHFAYSTDVVRMPEEAFECLAGVKVWLIGVFTNRPHSTHAHVDLALEWIERVKPEQAWLTHMGPALDYQQLMDSLPPHVRPVYDGQVLEIPD